MFWLMGVGIYMFGRSSMALGGNLQRYSMLQEWNKPDEHQRSKMKQPILVLGIVLFVVSGLFLSAALLFAPMSILGPCGVVFLVANAGFAHRLNGERFVWAEDGICSVLIMAGVITCIVAAPKTEDGQDDGTVKTYTADEIETLLSETTFFIYLALVVSFVGCFMAVKEAILRQVDGDWEVLAGHGGKMTVVNLSFGCVAGALGGFNETVTKSMLAVIGGVYNDQGFVGLWINWILYVMGITLACSFIFQLFMVTSGLEKCTAMVVLATQAVIEDCFFGSLGGLLYFQDYKQFSPTQAWVYGLGNVVAIASIVCMVFLRVKRDGAERATVHPEDRKGRDKDPAADAVTKKLDAWPSPVLDGEREAEAPDKDLGVGCTTTECTVLPPLIPVEMPMTSDH
eukprot:TRINITY_DN13109_c0_g1_i3.p1 TRINITY_DN13109_c0_g1~~TRINITY_DN13109_c0_g1_i3.p1  ORF type:complete len:398 (+),score=104.85 TRINITY_DN13109_c0_g1_i3:320-1513(+)